MKQAGFTLLEVLVALVVLGLVLAGLAQGTRFGLRVAERQTATIAASADGDATERVLRGLIEQMDPGSLTSASLLQAGPASLAFTANLAAVAPGLGVGEADVGLGVTPDHRLVLRWTPHLHATRLTAPPVPTQTTLLTGVAGVAFAYCCGEGDSGQWLAAWTQPTLPALVRVRLSFLPGTRRTWPAIVVAPARMRLNG
jgi:general secretion pathway protein J